MQNCSGRAAFNANYSHDELRTPTMLIQNSGGAAGLSINAPEFVPKRNGPPMAANVGPHHAYPQQQQQQQPPPHPSLAYQQQQQLTHLQQQQQPHLAHQPALYGGVHQAHHHPHQHHQHQQQQQHNHMSHPSNRRGGGGGHRQNLQERLNPNTTNPFADHNQQQQHHHHNHQQQHHQQQYSMQHQQQHQSHRNSHHQQHHQQQHQHLMQHQQQHQQQMHQHHQHQDRRNNRAQVDNNAYNAANALDQQNDENPSDAELGALAHLTQVMGKLMDDPGMFEACQKELNAVYIEFAQNCFVISNSIEILFEQSINESNFRYMGARICRLLDGIVASPESIFREMLSAKMMDTQQQNKTFIKNEANKVRGCALFLGELFLQLQNDGSRISAIAENIHKTLDELLQKLTPENIKCVCQTLKLCGYELEMDCPNEVATIIAVLRQQKDVDVSTERLINSVLDLQGNRWGRNEAASLASTVHIDHNSQQAFTNDPVFYGPDGKIITEEESSFLSGILTAATDALDDEDDLDPGMDDEMKLAFKDFVKNYSSK